MPKVLCALAMSRRTPRSRNPSPMQRQPRAPRPQPQAGEFVMGRNCVEELLRHDPERLREVLFAGAKDDRAPGGERRESLRERLEELGIPARELPRRDIDNLVSSDSHQGVIARVSPRRYLDFDRLVESVRSQERALVLALDGVLDPQNFGAILRAAECFGVDAVLWSKNRAAPLGAVVSKASVGASEIVPLCPVSNVHQALEVLKSAGAWTVGAMVSPDAASLDSFEFPAKCVIVVGSEGEGVQRLIEKNLDFRVYIAMRGKISSLNVSQATAVMLHSVANQHRQK